MNRAILFVVVLAGLTLTHHGYAEKTRVDPSTVVLLGDQSGSLSLVGVQSDGQFIVSGDFDIIDGRVLRTFARITADGRLDADWGNNFIYTSLVMDGDDVYAEWVDNAGNRNITLLNEHGAVGTNWVYTTTNDSEIVAVNGTGVFIGHFDIYYATAYLTKINKRTGVADWSYMITNDDTRILRIDDTGVYIVEGFYYDQNNIYKLDNATGEQKWVLENIVVGYVWGAVASDGVSLYYTALPGLLVPIDYYISRIGIERGVVDSNWLCKANGYFTSFAVDDTGVYAGGVFTQIGGVALSGIAKIDKTNALPVSNWNVAVTGLIVTALQTDDNSIYAIGSAGTNYLAKIDKMAGAVDWARELYGYNPVSVAITGTSVFLSAANSNSFAGFAKFDKATGAMQAFLGDHTFYNAGAANCLARQADGKIYIGGDFVAVNGKTHVRHVRLNADGSVDDGWRCDQQRGNANAIAVDDTGVYVAADFGGGTISGGWSIISKVTTSPGMTITNWQYDIGSYYRRNAHTYAILVDAASVYVGGYFDSSGNTAHSAFIVKLDKMTGEVDFRWNSGDYTSEDRRGMASALVLDGNSVYAGGYFSEIGGRPRNHVAKLDKTSGKADALWNAQWPFNEDLTIGAIVVDGSAVYISGYYNDDYDGHLYASGIAKLDKTTGRADPAWRCAADGAVNCLVIDGGWLYAGGGFLAIGGAARSHIARLNKTTGLVDPQWIHNTDGDVSSLLVANSVCYLAGRFTRIGLQDHFGFGAILPASASTPGDYDGDHIADLALYQPSTGQWQIKLSGVRDTPFNFSMTSGSSWIPVRGDFDGDGRTDPALYSPDIGQFAVRASARDYFEYYVSLGGSGCVPVPGDYDNDGTTDFMVCLPTYGLWTGLLSSSGFMPVALPSLGGPGWTPLTGDFNGDGSCDPAVYNEITGQWCVLDSSRNYLKIDIAITLGGFGFQAMAGDFDGDGLSDFAAYSPALGEWDIALSALGYAKISGICGGEGYTPIPGDYDGDGITDIGVYSASKGQGIAIMSSRLCEQVQTPLGGPGYRPCNP